MARSEPTLVVFDCDGTIVDSRHVIVTAMQQAFAAWGLEAPGRAQILAIVGLSLPLAVGRLLPGHGERDVVAVADAYKAAFAELRRDPSHHEPVFPGARETIERLAGRPDVRLGIATGKSRRGLDGVLQRLGLASHFVTLQTADDNPSKPHPAMLERAMREADVAPARTVMIGDTTFDIEMARAATASAIGVAWGYHDTAELTAAGAHAIVASYPDLLELIERRLAGGEDAA